MPRSIPPVWVGRVALVAALVLASPLLAQCDRESSGPSPEPARPAPVQPEPLRPKAPVPALDRAAMAAALETAASAFAAGQAASDKDPLIGRTFDLRLPFACNGLDGAGAGTASGGAGEDVISDGSGLPSARWGAERRTIQLSFAPADWSDSVLLGTGAPGAKWEAVEGVWIPRPWLRTSGCPGVAADPLRTGAAPASPQTAGLAAVFETDGSRIGRRNGRAYSHVIRGDGEAAAVPRDGYRLRLAGRVVGFPGGRAVRCDAAGPDQRPVCIAAVQLDTVAFETADGQVLSTWTSG